MSKSKKVYSVEVIDGTPEINTYNIKKSLVPEQLDRDEQYSASVWRTKLYNQYGLQALVDDSTILPQCINAYGNNIAGYGISIRYNDDYPEETAEMKAEWIEAKRVLDLISTDKEPGAVFADIIKDRESIGIAYLEVIRDSTGKVVQIDHINEPHTIEMTTGLEPYEKYTYLYNGKPVERRKKFKKYRQTIGAKTVYFKEFGDPRTMGKLDGKYYNVLNDELTANEIIEFKIGTMPYGKVRWLGQTLNVDGARRAEVLNNNYFRKGRHTPMAIIIKGGSLTEDSKLKLRQYMNDIEGEKGQHGFLVLEAENTDTTMVGMSDEKKPDIEVKDLANVLQKDELFQEYLANGRRKTQSAFLLPDLYVGYTTDFNRATAQTAMEVTEKQVFQPEREALSWILNNKLFNCYGFKYIEFVFNQPDITNPDDIATILNITNAAGGLTLNVAKELTNKMLGRDAEPYDDSVGNLPLALVNNNQLNDGIDKAVEKALTNNDDDIVSLLRAIRKAITER